MADSTVDRLYKDMMEVYSRSYPEWDLAELLTKNDYPIARFRHIVRAKFYHKYECTLSEIAEAESCITGGTSDHSNISNSIKKFMKIHKQAETDIITRQAIRDVDLLIEFLQKQCDPAQQIPFQELLADRSKQELVAMCLKLTEWHVVREMWFSAALQHMDEEQLLPDSDEAQ